MSPAQICRALETSRALDAQILTGGFDLRMGGCWLLLSVLVFVTLHF